MSDDVTTVATIASLRADVVRLTAELQGEREDLAEKCEAYGDALVEETKLTTRIAALEEQVRQLTAENERLTNDAIKELIDSAAVREFSYHHQGDSIEARAVIQSPLMGLIGGWITGDFKRTSAVNFLEQELMFTAKDGDHRYTVNIRKSGGKTEAQVCGELRAELAERNAYAERLLAENVRFVNEATDLRERLDSTRQSIITACTGSGCVNASELRFALDQCREHGSTVAAKLTSERERCGVLEREVKEMQEYLNSESVKLDYQHVTKLRAEQLRAAARASVLERECRAERAPASVRQEGILRAAKDETDRTHALDAAKFVGGG